MYRNSAGEATRRRPLWQRPLLALVVVMALVAVACGGSDSKSGSSGDSSTAFDPNGTFTYSADIAASGGVAFDPIKGFRQTDEPYQAALYDTLLRKRPNGAIEPGLALDATAVDASTIEVKLRPNLKFSDGTSLDAEAAKFSLLRTRNGPNPQAFKGELLLLTDVVVVNPTTFQIKLKEPSAGAYFPLLYGNETTIVSPTAVKAGKDLNANPVGAGPFTLVSYTDGQKIVFKKSPTSWDADKIKLAGFTVVAIAAGPQNQTALRAGQINMTGVGTKDVATLTGSGFKIYQRGDSDSVLMLPICKTTKPLDQKIVRQALEYATDLDELNKALYDGQAEPMQALFVKDSPYFPKSLDGKYKYNPDKAKQLLAQAGVPNPDIGVITISGSEQTQRLAEVLQAQWAKVGVKLKIVPSTQIVDDFFIGAKQPLFTLPFARGGISKVTTLYVGDTAGNVCHYNNTLLNTQVQQLSALAQDSPEAIKLWQQIQENLFEDAASIWGLFTPIIWAYDAKTIGNMGVITATIQYPDFFSIYVKK